MILLLHQQWRNTTWTDSEVFTDTNDCSQIDRDINVGTLIQPKSHKQQFSLIIQGVSFEIFIKNLQSPIRSKNKHHIVYLT